MKKWIVLSGHPLKGYEFFGPYTEDEAREVRDLEVEVHKQYHGPNTWIVLAIELLKGPAADDEET